MRGSKRGESMVLDVAAITDTAVRNSAAGPAGDVAIVVSDSVTFVKAKRVDRRYAAIAVQVWNCCTEHEIQTVDNLVVSDGRVNRIMTRGEISWSTSSRQAHCLGYYRTASLSRESESTAVAGFPTDWNEI